MISMYDVGGGIALKEAPMGPLLVWAAGGKQGSSICVGSAWPRDFPYHAPLLHSNNQVDGIDCVLVSE